MESRPCRLPSLKETDRELRRPTLSPKKRKDAIAVGTNLSLMSQLVFDWLDEIFDDRAAGAQQRERTTGT